MGNTSLGMLYIDIRILKLRCKCCVVSQKKDPFLGLPYARTSVLSTLRRNKSCWFVFLFQVSVNEFCLLYFVDVTKEEAGNYTCYVDEVLIQQNKVIVDEVYQVKKQSLQRHIKYLLYIILICFVILVGGVAMGCIQRQNFKKINEEEVIEMYAGQRSEHERLLPPMVSNDE